MLDAFFFVFAGVAAVWLAYLSLSESFNVGWWGIPFAIVFWVLLAYLVLPRVHRILTTIYVPDYFIGRARTSDCLLGDPINLAFMGDAAQLRAAMTAAKWTPADPVTLRSSLRIVTSTLTRRSYDEAPVSPLFLFGRQQDFAFQQEVDGNPAQRHHVRFWKCPPDWPLPGGRRVDWLAAATFDTRVGLSLFTLQVTHKIDANTDVERDHVVATLRAGDPAVRVEVLRDFSTSYHARNGGGDSIHTDGDLPIVDVGGGEVGGRDAGGESADAGAHAHPSAQPSVLEPEHPEPTASGASAASAIVPRKRAAFESPAELFTAPDADPRMPRPSTTVAGVALVLLRVLAGVLVLAGVWWQWPTLISDGETLLEPISPEALDLARLVIVAVGGTVLLVDLVVAVFVWRGSNVGRVLILLTSLLSVTGTFTAWWARDQEITVHSALIAVGLDVLILLALSSRSAAAFARRRERR